jgi:transposase
VFRIKKWDLLMSVGTNMTKGPKNNNVKEIEKTREELQRKRQERFYQKMRFQVAELRAKGWSVRRIAEYIDMSIGFVHKWILRLVTQIDTVRRAVRDGKKRCYYDKGDGIKNGIKSRSTAPKTPRKKITAEHVNTIKRIRNSKFTKKMGAQKIKVYADPDISHQSIHKIMVREGLVKQRKKRKNHSFDPFRRGCPNELWQIDYKEFEPGIYMLSVKDDHSSAILSADVRTSCTTDDAIEIVEKTMKLFGCPKQILSDHGAQWYATRGGEEQIR